MFGDKHIPAVGPGHFYATTLEEYRKCSYPLPVGNSTQILFGVLGTSAIPLMNTLYYNRPFLAGSHRALALGVFGVWVGYYFQRAYEQYYFGKFKYCLDYALTRKDLFPKKVPVKYGDPKWLNRWQPVR